MTISNNGFISIVRGESFTVPLFINNGTVFHPMIKIKHGDGSIDTIVPETEFFIFDNAAGVANGKSKFNRKQGNVIK